MTLFERVFGGNDYNYERTVAAIDAAIAQYGESEPVAFPNTAYALPCYYGVTGVKITNLGEMKAAMETIKANMTRNNRLQDVFDSGINSSYGTIVVVVVTAKNSFKKCHGISSYKY